MISVIESIVGSFGDPNIPLSEEELDAIYNELDTLDDDELFECALHAIEMGKPSIFDYITELMTFTMSQLRQCNESFEQYIDDYGDRGDYVQKIINEFDKMLRRLSKPRNKYARRK